MRGVLGGLLDLLGFMGLVTLRFLRLILIFLIGPPAYNWNLTPLDSTHEDFKIQRIIREVLGIFGIIVIISSILGFISGLFSIGIDQIKPFMNGFIKFIGITYGIAVLIREILE
jgi:hypothetical protein